MEEAPEFYEEFEPDEGNPKLVRTKTYPVKPMTVEDAIDQMGCSAIRSLSLSTLKNSKACVIYQRKDGTLGLLEPNE